jgi:hypothetical protein
MRWLAAPDLYDDPDPEIYEWLKLVKIAKHLGCKPWELIGLPAFWKDLGELDIDVQNLLNSKIAHKQ